MRSFLFGLGLLVLQLGLSDSADAQLSDKFLFHRGWIIGNYSSAPFYFAPDTTFNQIDDTISYKNSGGLQLGLNWGGRVNLYDISDEKSVTLHVDLVGSAFVSSGILNGTRLPDVGLALQIPIVVNYNIGHMATKSSTASRGFGFGVGVEINRVFSLLEQTPFYAEAAQRGFSQTASASFVQPVMNFGYRYWNRNDLARELNIQFGFGKSYNFVHGTTYRPNFRLSLHRYFNY
jgi:hypothetical protein